MTTGFLAGLRVVTSEHLTEYEPGDEGWRQYFGFVTDEVKPSGRVMRMGDVLYMHPATFAAVKLALTPGGAA